MDEVITKEQLQKFFRLCQYWSKLLERKQNILQILGLKAIDYSKDRVMSGSKKNSEEERYILALERINNELNEICVQLNNDQSIIKSQLKRMTNPIYSKIIQLKYVDHWKTWEIIEDLFIGHPKWNPELNLDEFKKSADYESFRNQYYKLERNAIKSLEKITGTAFVPNQNQLRIL